MEALIFSFTRHGSVLSLSILAFLKKKDWKAASLTVRQFAEQDRELGEITPNLQEAVQEAFLKAELIVFVGAVGIAVRSVAPFIKSKQTDPAVIVVDESGAFVIPILSGHIGGANAWSHKIAAHLHGQAVITTATDVNHLFAVDEWAVQHHLIMPAARIVKAFSAALLEQGKAGIYSDFPIQGELPPGLENVSSGRLGVAVTLQKECRPFDQTVLLHPRILHLGIGCRRGTEEAAIAGLVYRELRRLGISMNTVAAAGTIDIKRSEPGLTRFFRTYTLPVHYYSAAELQQLPGNFTRSEFVLQTVAVDNVCERAAVLSSGGGSLLLDKTVADGVTLAIACENFTVSFDTVRR